MKTLRMKFALDSGKTRTISLNYAKDTVSASAVEAAMNSMLDDEMLVGQYAGLAGADLVDRTVTHLL